MKYCFFFIVTSLYIFSVVTQRNCLDSLNIQLGVDDLNEIKSKASLCSYNEDCYLTWSREIIEDQIGIQVNSFVKLNNSNRVNRASANRLNQVNRANWPETEPYN